HVAGVVPRARVAVVAGRPGGQEVDALTGVGVADVAVARRRLWARDGAEEDAAPLIRIGVAGRARPLLTQVSLRALRVPVAGIDAVGVGLYVQATERVAGRVIRGTGVDRAVVGVGTGSVARARDGETRGAVALEASDQGGARRVEGERGDL